LGNRNYGKFTEERFIQGRIEYFNSIQGNSTIIVVPNHNLEKMKKENYQFGINLVNDGIIV
jgi:hypothetical protein